MSDNDDKLVDEINEMFHTLHQKEAEYRAMFGPIPAPDARRHLTIDPDDHTLDMGEASVDEYCSKCGEKMLLNYGDDDVQFSTYYICEDCPAEEEQS